MQIEIVDYDPRWPAMFELERTRLGEALGEIAVRIDHVGSTSVVGLAAKPLIDIQVTVVDPSLTSGYQPSLESAGYTFTTIPFGYFHRPSDWPHTHHVHVREHEGFDARRTLAFRDWLRTHPHDRDAYARLKRRLASQADAATAEGRFRYSEAKTDFIREIERRARGESPQAKYAR